MQLSNNQGEAWIKQGFLLSHLRATQDSGQCGGREQRTGLLALLESKGGVVKREPEGQEETGEVTHMVI